MKQPNENKKQVGTKLDVDLYRRARIQAMIEDRAVGDLYDEAIRAYLEQKESTQVIRKRTKPPQSAKAKG